MVIHRAFQNKLIKKTGHHPRCRGRRRRSFRRTASRRIGSHGLLGRHRSGALLVQARARTRWLDPTQYDWPAEHWHKAKYPWDPSVHIPLLDYPASRANGLARDWTLALHTSPSVLAGRLLIRYKIEVTSINPIAHSSDLEVTLSGSATSIPTRFSFILWATGFGKERCEIPTPTPSKPYRGHPFWDTDKLKQKNCDIPPSRGPAKVLITGSGDGALQDFLRVVTKLKSAEEIYRTAAVPTEIANTLAEHEDRAVRQMTWGDGPHHDHSIHKALDTMHKSEIYKAWSDPKMGPRLRAGMRKIFTLHPLIEHVTLAYPCDHLSPQLPLNRFLTQLIYHYFTTAPDHPSSPKIEFLSKVSALTVIWPRLRTSTNLSRRKPYGRIPTEATLL